MTIDNKVNQDETKTIDLTCELKYWVEKKKRDKCPSAIVLELTDCYNCNGKRINCDMYIPRVTY